MIWESRYWKADLLRFAEQLRRARTKAPPFTDRTCVAVEKAVLMGAFVIRRLADSHKLSDAVAAMQLRVTQIPSTGKRVTLLNNHRLAELFDFSRSARGRQSLPFLCNQAIHSHVLGTYAGRAGKALFGVYVASDHQRNKALFAVPLSEIERAFRKVGSDYPTHGKYELDEKTGDYRVTQLTRSRRPRSRSS